MPTFASVRTGTPTLRQASKETPRSWENWRITERKRASSCWNSSSSSRLRSSFSKVIFSWILRTFTTPSAVAISCVSCAIVSLSSSGVRLFAPRPRYLCFSSAFMYASIQRDLSRPSAKAFLFSSDIPWASLLIAASLRLFSAGRGSFFGNSRSLVCVVSPRGRRASGIDTNRGRTHMKRLDQMASAGLRRGMEGH